MDIQSQFEKQLNPRQLEAVNCIHGPLLILAGAGSGKTRVLTYRIANMIAQGEASPDEILAVTFTNKAAREMLARTHGLLESLGLPVHGDLWISTFHSSCVRILREHIHLLDFQPFFVIYDDSDQLAMIRKCLTALDINEKTFPPKAFKAKINEAKMLGLTPDQVHKKSYMLMDENCLKVYEYYEEQMRKANALDFGDLLLKTHELFTMYPDILEQYQNKFKFILVDEYQDTNHIQYLLVQLLAKKHRNLCVVGDEDQSIYSWRGADISNILDFEKDFEECKTVKLEENYRSTKNIVEAATEVIKNNSQRKAKTLFTSNQKGSLITVKEERNDYDEGRFVAQTIETLMRDSGDYSYSDFAIFYRTNAQSRVIEDQLRSRSIAYKIFGGVKFYERMEIKDILGYMKLILNAADDIALKRIINVPARGIGKTTVEKIEAASHEQNLPMLHTIEHVVDQRIVHAGACKKLRAFKNLMAKLVEQSKELKLSEIYHLILDQTEYVLKLKSENTPESLARIDNLEEFNNAIVQFEKERGDEANMQSFLEEMALVSDVDKMEDEDNCVSLMTLHISKGLEFPNVFVVGLEEGLFPTARAFNDGDPTAMEEERRLAYVGMTRARENLFLTYARSRRVWGQEQNHAPSRFIEEIPQQYLKFETALRQPAFLDKYKKKYGSGDEFGRAQSFSGGQSQFKNKYKSNKGSDFDEMPNYEEFGDDATGVVAYRKGMRVRHPTFGAGTISGVEGQGENQKVSVMFNNSTMKKFVVKYARLEVL